MGDITFLNIDCMEYMATQPDNAFDLAIVDPPYFNGPQAQGYYDCNLANRKKYLPIKNWEIPDEIYINELSRVSENQIIWGINYFNVCMPGGRIVWVKSETGIPYSQADIAYHSFYNRIEIFDCLWNGFRKDPKTKKEIRIHPTQKPCALYDWLLDKYAKRGQRILDTHLGSGSSAIAAHYFGCDFVGCEIDEDYYNAAKKRFDNETRQTDMFEQKQVKSF